MQRESHVQQIATTGNPHAKAEKFILPIAKVMVSALINGEDAKCVQLFMPPSLQI